MKLKLFSLLCALCCSPWLQAQLSAPQGIVFDAKGNLWVANSSANQVQELDPSSGTVLATITVGLDGPTRLAFGPFGYLYVANTTGNTVTVYDAKLNQIERKTIASDLHRPAGVAVDAYGDVFVSNNATNKIAVFDVDGDLVERLAQDNSGLTFTAPNAIAVRGTLVFISIGPTAGENTVRAYNPGEFLTSNPKYRGEFTDLINTGPTGIAFDDSGSVYVSDFYSNSWVKFSPNGELLLTVTTDIDQPQGIAVDRQGNVYVANSQANTITIYNPQGVLINTLK
jgi:DNA-binding beta-propeller fold protein YncE